MLPHARFVLEVETPRAQPAHVGQWGGRWVERSDGSKILLSWLSLYDEGEQICRAINRYELFKAGALLAGLEFTYDFMSRQNLRLLGGRIQDIGSSNYRPCEPDGAIEHCTECHTSLMIAERQYPPACCVCRLFLFTTEFNQFCQTCRRKRLMKINRFGNAEKTADPRS
jgi:hypothetical protein